MVKISGYIMLLISCLSFLAILLVPWFELTTGQMAGLTTGLIITGEILFYASLIILGRSFFNKIKNKLKFWKSKPNDPGDSNSNKSHEQKNNSL